MDRSRMRKLLVQVLLGVVVAIISIFIASRLTSACPLDNDQIAVLNNISSSLNISNATLISIFNNICYKLSFNTNATAMVNSSLFLSTNTSMSTVNSKLDNLTSMFYQINTGFLINSSNYYDRTAIDATTSMLQSRINNNTEAMDGIYSSIRKEYVTNKSITVLMKNTTSGLEDKIYDTFASSKKMIDDKCSTARMTWFWVAVILVAVIFGAAYLFRYKPEIVDKYVRGVKGIRRSVTETTTPGEYSVKIDKVRELSKIAVDNNLKKDQKQELLNKIRSDEIKDEKSLDDEIKIIRGLEKYNGFKKGTLSQIGKKRKRE